MQVRYVLDSRNISSEEFDGEVVAVNFATGKYYGMKGCADLLWRFFEAPHSEAEAVTFAAACSGVEESVVDASVREFIGRLVEEGVLQTTDAPTDETSPVPLPAGIGHFEPPELEIHSDLQELILLDPVHDTDPEQGWPLRRAEPNA